MSEYEVILFSIYIFTNTYRSVSLCVLIYRAGIKLLNDLSVCFDRDCKTSIWRKCYLL